MERGGFYFPYQHNDNDIPAKCRQGDDLLFCALFPQNSGCSSLMCGGKLFIIECMNWDNQFSPKHIIQILTLQTLQTGNGFYFRTGLKCLFIELAADYVSISRNNEKIIGSVTVGAFSVLPLKGLENVPLLSVNPDAVTAVLIRQAWPVYTSDWFFWRMGTILVDTSLWVIGVSDADMQYFCI